MQDPFNDENGDWQVVFSDFLLSILGMFMLASVILLPFIAPLTQQLFEAQILSPGNIIVDATWDRDVDIDLWVLSPGDIRPVGYSNKGGKVFNLLRDDLGYVYERSKDRHYENAYSRGMPKGEYIINVHYFRSDTDGIPIIVEVTVTISKDVTSAKEQPKKVVKTKIELINKGQEETAIRFRIDDEGNIIPGSVNNIKQPLRNK